MPREVVRVDKPTTWRTPRFHNVKDDFTGLLLKPPVTRQKKKFGTNELEFWDEEKQRPRMEHVYDFLLVSEAPFDPKGCHFCRKIANERKAKGLPAEDNSIDTGARRLYASDKQHWTMQKAMLAIDGQPELYGPITLRYEDDDLQKKKPGFEAPKVWKAEYRIPTDAEVELCDKFLGYDPEAAKNDPNQEFGSLLEDSPTSKMNLEQMSKAAAEEPPF